jgi:hypothetical protein
MQCRGLAREKAKSPSSKNKKADGSSTIGFSFVRNQRRICYVLLPFIGHLSQAPCCSL